MFKFLRKHHILHTWGKWETTATGQLLSSERFVNADKIQVTGFYTRQQRVCEVCNKVQLRTAEC